MKNRPFVLRVCMGKANVTVMYVIVTKQMWTEPRILSLLKMFSSLMYIKLSLEVEITDPFC